MDTIIDVSEACGTKAAALAAAGVRTIIRYYSRDTVRPTKRLSRAEALLHDAAGLRIGVVHEGRHGDQVSNFDYATGVADADYARAYGANVIGQSSGSTIYFGVDVDATAAEIEARVLPYFRGIANAWAGDPRYEVGVYGSGATCKAVLDAGLARRAWLAQSTGWTGYAAFSKSKSWALKQSMPDSIADVPCDPDTPSDTIAIGDFALGAAAGQPAVAPQAAHAMRVNARHGLRLRPGPGTEFDPVATLALNRIVYPLKTVGSWTLVDLSGDGAADGFVSSAYLAEPIAMSSDGVAPAPPHHVPAGPADATHIPELILQGSTAAGLKAARRTAAAGLPGYPHNGCAAHLSALLDQSGIDVPMTWGAGKLAQRLADRGWAKVPVGSQVPGDVGVCFDNNPNVAGSDHIYLVVGTSGPDQMMIADNQRTSDAPHSRFASGRGKTPTEYFLRA